MERLSFNEVRKVSSKTDACYIHTCPQPLQKSLENAKIDNERLGSRKIWKVTKKNFNRGKSFVLVIIKDPKVISSSSDIAKIFGIKFASNPMLDDRGHPLPGPHTHVTQASWSYYLGSGIFSDSTKKTQMHHVRIKSLLLNLSPELYLILAKLFPKSVETVSGIVCFQECWWTLIQVSIPLHQPL